MRYLEDFEVGEKDSFGAYAVTREEVLEFARKYDAQPFHLSDEGAAATHFGRLAASGWHTCAMMMAMLVEQGKKKPAAGLGSPGINELRWLKPVFPGDTLRVETEVTEVRASRSRPDMGSVHTRTAIYNQNDEPVLTLNAIVLMGRRPT